MNELLSQAIQSCTENTIAFTKFIAANETGATGGHQAGFYLPQNSWPLFFDSPGKKGNNKDVFVTIKWQNDFETKSRFIYYGSNTRNEYRLTRFGRGFPFLRDNNIGDLFIISKKHDEYYEAFVLSNDEDIDEFLSYFGVSHTDTNKIFKITEETQETNILKLYQEFIDSLSIDFPSTYTMAEEARNIFYKAYDETKNNLLKFPDKIILRWILTEFELFKALEDYRYKPIIQKPFPSVENLIQTANSILNRRKARAGKSLELHLSEVFNIWKLSYSAQPTTEGNKKPDFIFPNIESYFKESTGSSNLIFLGAKTTCKDRWRQIIGEADRIPHKHLFTLQQGISSNQLKEMKLSGVTLVVPAPYLSSFPNEHKKDIWTFDKFLKYVKHTQN